LLQCRVVAKKKRAPQVREPMWDVDDIAHRLGLKPGSTRNHITRHPEFPAVAKVSGNARLWWSNDVENWIDDHRPADSR
jgi:predicted DNA-binding transcriptional regulator AlpA